MLYIIMVDINLPCVILLLFLAQQQQAYNQYYSQARVSLLLILELISFILNYLQFYSIVDILHDLNV
jgi:hypothetical protein